MSNRQPDVPDASDGASQGLRSSLHDRGQRLTPQRERMLELFERLGEGRHLSAEEAHQRLRVEGEQVSLATVYRTLRLLSGMGLLKELELAEGGRRFELAGHDHRHHHHLVCVRCGRIEEFENADVLAAAEAAATRHGFRLLEGVLNVRALCPACAALQEAGVAPAKPPQRSAQIGWLSRARQPLSMAADPGDDVESDD